MSRVVLTGVVWAAALSSCGGRTSDSGSFWPGEGGANCAGSPARQSGGSGGAITVAGRGTAAPVGGAGRGGYAFGGLPASGGAASGGEAPGDPTYVPTGLFDPAQVVLWGTLEEGACYRDAIARWSNPNQAETGFSCGTPDGSARPQWGVGVRTDDQRLVFVLTSYGGKNALREFIPDGNGTGIYPAHPHANDPVIPTTCDDVRELFLDPTGGLVYRCDGAPPCTGGTCHYYRDTGEPYLVPDGYYLIWLGYEGKALLGDSSKGFAIGTGSEVVPVARAIPQPALRAHRNGFWAVTGASSGTAPARWNIAFDGTVVLDGEYPEPPTGSYYPWPATAGDWSNCALEAAGAVLCFGRSTINELDGQILRSQLGDPEATVVYTESTFPLVKVHISYLVTGP